MITSCPFSSGRRGDAGCVIFQQGIQLRCITCGRKARLSGTNHCERLVRRKMRQSLFQGAGKMREISARCDAQDGFAKAKNAVRRNSRDCATQSSVAPVITICKGW